MGSVGSDGPGSGGGGTGSPAAAQFRLRRTGGVAGLRVERTVALGDLPDSDAQTWRDLFVGDRLRTLAADAVREQSLPDAFTYHLAWPPDGEEVALPERGIPAPIHELIARTLAGPVDPAG